MKITRRNFIRSSGIVSLGFLGLARFNDGFASPEEHADGKYGPLLPDPEKIINLPKGFRYKIISERGKAMSDGLRVPGLADGMAAFEGKGSRTIIVRNHEVNINDPANGPFGKNNELLGRIDRRNLYDFGKGKSPCLGGTTTVVYDHGSGQVEKEFLSLAGTVRNCAGGPTPWGSWLTCEETTVKADDVLEKDHGYVFEVPAGEATGLANPVPLKSMGRFNHEAVAIEPQTGIVYLTEDDDEGLVYRFIPRSPGKLSQGGRLQALCLMDKISADTSNRDEVLMISGRPQPVRWIDLKEIDAPDGDLHLRGYHDGAARFARGEGMWYGNGHVYFACTSGGRNKKGQIFRYRPGAHEGTLREKESPGQLELFVEPNDTDLFKSCDNLTVAPWGDVVLCEDDSHSFIVGVTPKGDYYRLAENVGFKSEFAGGVFSPNGQTFFVNIQGPGLTLAIEGPWR